ncbi:sugar porter family MFS transporter [Herbiconiux sp. KACC 21604]|uniref:sugar porter family MFS transporter n=1 Tax=unclassified Herbiconiux TaxID=2618217 RepID=UPI0014930C08|nr:sugar porter family MFS transporter [Herbiconiux sp. SALV-R1]QJU52866.1 sugar porter family MFS transporter [Herbiconiux sp. SALV-R1]WPO87784.1 sugar porter family MFS transporter [Herbiconiux sp. KACC 21604]
MTSNDPARDRNTTGTTGAGSAPRTADNRTPDDPAASKKLRRKVIALSIAAALGGFLFGFDSSVINGAVKAIEEDFDLGSLPLLSGFTVASALLGCAVGAYVAGRIADRIGRIPVMLIGAALFLVSSIGSGLAFAVWDLIAWRVIGGLGIGIASVIAPAYIAEIAPKAVRGALASLQQLAITLGIFAALLSDTLLQGAAGGANEPLWFGADAWRWMFIACAVPAIVYGLLAWRLPESPRFLAGKERRDDARDVLASVMPQSEVDSALEEIERGLKEDRENDRTASLRGKMLGLLPVVWVGILLSMFQQLVGINVIFYYSQSLWASVGFDTTNQSTSFIISVITSVINVAVTFVAIFFVDKIGRRPLLLTGSAGMVVSLGLMALSFSQAVVTDGGTPQLPGAWGPLALVGANLFVIFFGATWGPIVWVLLGEIFPNRIRGKALGVAAAAQWLTNFAITETFPALSGFSLAFTYGLYTFFALVSFFFVFFAVPETKGRSLESMDSLKVVRKNSRQAVDAPS